MPNMVHDDRRNERTQHCCDAARRKENTAQSTEIGDAEEYYQDLWHQRDADTIAKAKEHRKDYQANI